ncbi:MAG TPA: hypothetical protein VKT82_00740 [Ktedonobacterales bacterium]|nr:hypothetical protein [Ktedonobacterales bacterium]
MTSTAPQPSTPVSGTRRARLPELWRGVLIGLLPLLALAVALAVVSALTTGARALTVGLGFSAEQLATALTLGVGLALGFTVYAIALVRVWRRITAWRLAGQSRQAIGAFSSLAITALVILLPVVLALLIPQHPAP